MSKIILAAITLVTFLAISLLIGSSYASESESAAVILHLEWRSNEAHVVLDASRTGDSQQIPLAVSHLVRLRTRVRSMVSPVSVGAASG
jgi:hypothetical protein